MPENNLTSEQRKQNIIDTRGDWENEHVIEFRDDKSRNHKRKSWKIDIDHLFLRKNNGRITSDTRTWEKLKGPIDENSNEGQKILRDMIYKKDKTTFDTLSSLIQAHGQEQPAVCLADGTLLNGNRRLAVIKSLYEENRDAKYKTMECVVLPTGNPDDGYGHGAAPTKSEIADLEYAYQMRRSGFSEYTGLNKAFMYKRGIEQGRELSEMIAKNPTLNVEGITKRKFDNVVKKEKAEYLDTLESFEEYLAYFGREGIYEDMDGTGNISGDRWQAFIDYTKSINTISNNPDTYNINTNDIGDVKKAAFKLIRQQNLHAAGKLHDVMRSVPKILKEPQTKKVFNKLFNDEKIPPMLPDELDRNEEGNPLEHDERDDIWRNTVGSHIVNIAVKIKSIQTHQKDTKATLNLLDDALSSLNHDNMDARTIETADNDTCMNYCQEISDRALELLDEFDHNRQNREAFEAKRN